MNRGFPTKVSLLASNREVDCLECRNGCECNEDELHLFFHCQVAKVLWFAFLEYLMKFEQ